MNTKVILMLAFVIIGSVVADDVRLSNNGLYDLRDDGDNGRDLLNRDIGQNDISNDNVNLDYHVREGQDDPAPAPEKRVAAPLRRPRLARGTGVNDILYDKPDSYGQVGHLKSNWKRYVGGVNNKDVGRAGWGAQFDPTPVAKPDAAPKKDDVKPAPAQDDVKPAPVQDDEGDNLNDDDFKLSDSDDVDGGRRTRVNDILYDKDDSYGQVGHLKSNWKRYVGGVNNKDVGRAGWGARFDPQYTTDKPAPAPKKDDDAAADVKEDDGDNLDDDDFRLSDADDIDDRRGRRVRRARVNDILYDKDDSYGQTGRLRSNWKRYVGGVNNKDVGRAGWGARFDPQYTTRRDD